MKFAICPAATVVEAGETGANEKSCPVPFNATVCGLPGALSLIVSVPGLAPLAVGSKKTPIAQLEPAATVLPQAFSVPKSAALVVTLVMLRGHCHYSLLSRFEADRRCLRIERGMQYSMELPRPMVLWLCQSVSPSAGSGG